MAQISLRFYELLLSSLTQTVFKVANATSYYFTIYVAYNLNTWRNLIPVLDSCVKQELTAIRKLSHQRFIIEDRQFADCYRFRGSLLLRLHRILQRRLEVKSAAV